MKVLTDTQPEIVGCDGASPKLNEIQQLLNNHEKNDNGLSNISRCPFTEISELLPSLYLCGASATCPDVLENLGVTFVVNAAPELPDTPLPDSKPLYIQVPVMDHADVDLSKHFDEISDLIEDVRLADGKTLIHCVAGVSRSASLCIAYLMKYMRMTLRDAFFHVRSIRPRIRPNMGFFRQLISYEEKIFGKTSVKWIFYESLQKEIPDVYENEYRSTELFYQKYRQNIKRR